MRHLNQDVAIRTARADNDQGQGPGRIKLRRKGLGVSLRNGHMNGTKRWGMSRGW